MTPQERRNIRLKNDYQEMCNIRCPFIKWEAIKGIAPYIEEYKVTVNIRSIINDNPTFREEHELLIQIPPDYPRLSSTITMVTHPVIFHPNWYTSDSRWCYGTWNISEGLGHHVIRMIKTLQFDLDITNPNSPANRGAKKWFLERFNSGIFPCDKKTLPDPTKQKMTISTNSIRKKFSVTNTEEEIIQSPKKRFNIKGS